MNHRLLVRTITTLCVIVSPILPAVHGQERKPEPKWIYRAVIFSEGEELATRELNALAADGWQYVGPISARLVAFKRLESVAAPAKVGSLSGTVTLDGKPLGQGTIQFTPIGAKLPVISANIVDGKYTAQVAAGKMQVSIRSMKSITGKGEIIQVEVIPPSYNDQSRLIVEAVPGKNEVNWDLKSR